MPPLSTFLFPARPIRIYKQTHADSLLARANFGPTNGVHFRRSSVQSIGRFWRRYLHGHDRRPRSCRCLCRLGHRQGRRRLHLGVGNSRLRRLRNHAGCRCGRLDLGRRNRRWPILSRRGGPHRRCRAFLGHGCWTRDAGTGNGLKRRRCGEGPSRRARQRRGCSCQGRGSGRRDFLVQDRRGGRGGSAQL
jgi:hypothetical protein